VSEKSITRQQAGLVRRARTSLRDSADVAGACSTEKFVVERAGEECDAREIEPNRKSRVNPGPFVVPSPGLQIPMKRFQKMNRWALAVGGCRSSAFCWPMRAYVAVIMVIGIISVEGALRAQTSNGKLKFDSGKDIYLQGCVSCHGTDGKGQAQVLAGFERPSTFPDFTDCPTATREPDVQWRAIVTNGGPARAFSQIMPSFKDLLTAEQIRMVVQSSSPDRYGESVSGK